ncbi:MAG: alkaline phosphatase [Burkholderiales bacterium PBB1]|nr:MAG: alkaline phosphatase [Burkholderiales bacterium PBB1]
MSTTRRQFLHASTATALGGSTGWCRSADDDLAAAAPAASVSIAFSRFDLGIASGSPTADSVVLWTRLTGSDLPTRVEVQWELAHDEAFTRIAARGTDMAAASWAHSVHAQPRGLEPGRWYWYRFQALGERSATGRTRTAPRPNARATTPLRFAIASCQRYDAGHYAAWRDVAEQNLDLVMFLGDYIYEGASRSDFPRRHEGGEAHDLESYRARYATYKRDPLLQAAHASAPWLMVWDDHEVENDYAGLQDPRLDPLFPARRAAAYQAYWEHMPFPKAARPRFDTPGGAMRITGRLDWGSLARIHLLDGRQHRDPQACPRPGRGGSNTVKSAECAALLDPRRTLLGAEQERWLAEGWDLHRPWNLLAQQTLMARHSWTDTADGGGTYWSDGWDGYPLARQRLLGAVAKRRVPGVVVLGGDVHAHVVADLKADFDRPESPTVATEFCGTSIASHGRPQELLDMARTFNPHIQLSRSDRRGCMLFTLDAEHLQVALRAVDDVNDPASNVRTSASFVVEADRPGAIAA